MDEAVEMDSICREIGLNSPASRQLQSGIKKYIEKWNRFADPDEMFDRFSDSDFEEHCSRYLDNGWDRNERVGKGTRKGKGKGKGPSTGAIVPPGRVFWERSMGQKHTKYEYPRDRDMYVVSDRNS